LLAVGSRVPPLVGVGRAFESCANAARLEEARADRVGCRVRAVEL